MAHLYIGRPTLVRSARADVTDKSKASLKAMSSYHFSMQIISRSQGRSAVAAAAYRAGERLADRVSGRVADYRKRRGVVMTAIMVPTGAAHWLRDRERLWNAVQRCESRRDAQLAREVNFALPHELSDAERTAL